jgi:hypothetical protein|tara:strand:+ start:2850 stop:3008 length:159 start_codon:yes stop_codon:yes gene_type:complete
MSTLIEELARIAHEHTLERVVAEMSGVSRVWRIFDYEHWYKLRQKELEEAFK